MGDVLLHSLTEAFTPVNILYMIFGVGLGIVFGSLPGLTATMGVALLAPLTFNMETASAMFFLLGIYNGGIYGGSVSAVLINAPGTPASAATVADGYALTRKGRGGEALRMATFASTIAGIFSALVLIFVAPQIAKFALNFGPTEYFALALFGLTMISSVSGGSLVKGLIMGFLGLLVSCIGLDPIGAVPRLTFGSTDLMGGVALIPALVGLFAIAEIINRAQNLHLDAEENKDFKDSKLPFSRAIKHIVTIIKGSAIGTFVGSIPGTGAAIASFLSYNEAKRAAKGRKKDEFGKGSLDGIAASESGNNGVTGATLIPLLTLGIPGDTVTAVMLGALTMQGLTPGPQLFVEHQNVVYAIMIGIILINIIMFIEGSLAVRLFIKVTKVPIEILIPVLLTLCFVGAYAVNNSLFDAQLMMIFGLLGYIMPKFGFPITPLLLGIVLGRLTEKSLRQALIVSNGDWSTFFTHKISLVFIILAFLAFLIPLFKMLISQIRLRVNSS